MSQTTDFETIGEVTQYLHENQDQVAVVDLGFYQIIMISVGEEVVALDVFMGTIADAATVKQDDTDLGEAADNLTMEDVDEFFTDVDELRAELETLLELGLDEDADLVVEAAE